MSNTLTERLIAALILGASLAWSTSIQAADWRTPEAEDLIYLQLGDERVIIELNDRFAPQTSKRIRELVRSGFYDGLDFYRVIDGFVAQGGQGEPPEGAESQPTLAAEFEIDADESLSFTPAQKPDLFAAESGFVEGFPAARDADSAKAWLTHCPGAVAMARGTAPDSGTTDYYIVIGQAPRYLDRNLTIFGRVIHGMAHVQRIRRGPSDANGIIEASNQRTNMTSVRVAADLPVEQRTPLQVIDTGGEAFQQTLISRRDRSNPFFHHKPPMVLDVCQVPVATRHPPPADQSSPEN
jgi:peptidylprolyl isomerase